MGITGRFAPDTSADDVAHAIRGFEDRVRRAMPDVRYICVEPIPNDEPDPPRPSV